MHPERQTGLTCFEVRRWVERQVRDGMILPINSTYCEHLAGCQSCRGALALLAGATVLPRTIDCAQCQRDLPVFVERDMPDAALIRRYPHIWWHLWTCAACADTYMLTRSLLMELSPQPLVAPARIYSTNNLPVLHLSREFLRIALPSQSVVYGVSRGREAGGVVIAEEQMLDGRELTLRVTEHKDNSWSIAVTIHPPAVGRLILELGSAVYRAPLDVDGLATIDDIPGTIIATPDGPDLTMTLEEDEN